MSINHAKIPVVQMAFALSAMIAAIGCGTCIWPQASFAAGSDGRSVRIDVDVPTDARPGSPHGLGVGLSIGDPTAIEGSYWLSRRQWVSVGLGTAFRSAFTVHGTFHHAFVRIEAGDQGEFVMPLYVGIGALFGAGHIYTGPRVLQPAVRIGARIPFGIEFWPQTLPLSFFFEVAPQITNHFPYDIAGGRLGARFHVQ